MATIISLKRRIQAARNVSKTTRAMQMVAASKLKKAQDAAFAARPYVEKLNTLTKNITANIDRTTFSHAYIEEQNKTGKTLVIVLAPDKGLCGSLITNLLKDFLKYQKAHNDHAMYISVGKKIEGKVAYFGKDIVASFPFGTTTPTMDAIYPIMKLIEDSYLNDKIDSVKVLYTHFNSFFNQKPTLTTLLPVKLEAEDSDVISKSSSVIPSSSSVIPAKAGIQNKKDENLNQSEYLFEPSAPAILPALLKHTVEMSLYHYLLESFLSEQASRMMAMQNATNNAKDIINDLLLEYNKTRQAKITSELLDITGAGFATAN
jgi:F-type H+-transporting ATPase subunit gamma